MTKKQILLIVFCATALFATAQVKIGDTTAPHSFSALEIVSAEKGVRLPQITDLEKQSITTTIQASASPELASGLVIYNTTNKRLEMWRDLTDKWVPLPDSKNSSCTVVSTIEAKAISPTTLNAYGTQDLVLEAKATGNSKNADLFYEWYRGTRQVGTGKQYKVDRNRLSFRDAGIYKVRVFSCAGTITAETKESNTITITINE